MILFENRLFDFIIYALAWSVIAIIFIKSKTLIEMFGFIIGGGATGFLIGFCWCIQEAIAEYWEYRSARVFKHFFSYTDDAFQTTHIFGTFIWYSFFFALLGIVVAYFVQ